MKKKITLQGILIIVAAALLGITGTTVGVMALMGQSSAVTVDNFVGKTKKVVETWRKDNSIETDRVTYVYAYDEEKEKDVVLRQNLKAGTSFTSDSNLKITLSNGVDPDKEFELPDFKDKTEKEVKAWFTDYKFTAVTYAYETDDSITPGNFISMDKESGSKVKRSDAIKVTICTPLEGEEVLVPSLATMSKDEIASWADQNRINVSFIERASDTVAQGGIISVSVTEGQRLKPGDSVSVEISSGPADQGEDRYNAQQKDNTEVNVTPPANQSVSGGNPTGNTTPSDNTNTGQTTTPPVENDPSGGSDTDQNTGNDNTGGGAEETESVYNVPDYSRIVMIAKNESDNESKKEVLIKYFKSYGIPDDCITVKIDPNGTQADIIVECNSTTSASDPIRITIVDNTQG